MIINREELNKVGDYIARIEELLMLLETQPIGSYLSHEPSGIKVEFNQDQEDLVRIEIRACINRVFSSVKEWEEPPRGWKYEKPDGTPF